MTIGNAEYVLGLLQYEESGSLPQYVIIVIGVMGGVLVLVLIIIISVCQRKRRKNDRQVKRLQAQLDALENNVRSECRQGKSKIKPTNLANENVGPLWHL